MEIRILTVGKIKEKYLNDGIAEYAKRLSRYCKLNFIQVPDEKTPDKASDALNRQIKETEGNRLLSHIREQDYVIALAIDGKMLDSVELSDLIARLGVQGKSSIVFVIGLPPSADADDPPGADLPRLPHHEPRTLPQII